MYKDNSRIFRFILILAVALTTFIFVGCEVSPYQCKQVTYLNGQVYSEYTWEANNFSECYCSEYDYQSGSYLFQVRCE